MNGAAAAFPGMAGAPNPMMLAQMQQQLLMNLSQSYQQLCLNQHDSSDRLRRLENRMMRSDSADDIVNAARREHLGIGSMPGGSSSYTHSPIMANPFRVPPMPEVAGPFSQRLAAGSAMEADSYLQQYRAARARGASAPPGTDPQFRLDPRPFGCESDGPISHSAYGPPRGFTEQDLQAAYPLHTMQSQVVQTDDIVSELSAVISDASAQPSAGARPKQRNGNNNQIEQELLALQQHCSPRAQSALARHRDASASEYSPLTTARTAENIQIDTILARDRGKIPPLDLDTILKNRHRM